MRSAILLGLIALAGCATAPGYRSSSVDLPASFRQLPDTNPTVVAAAQQTPARATPAPAAAVQLSVAYWEQLGDTTLSRLMREVLAANQDIQVAQARVSNARSEHTRAVLGSFTVPPSPETKSPRSYRSLDVAEYAVVIRSRIVSFSEVQRSLFRMVTAFTVVVTSLAVQEFRLLGQVTTGRVTGLIENSPTV